MGVIKIKAQVVETVFKAFFSDKGLIFRISTENEESDQRRLGKRLNRCFNKEDALQKRCTAL